MNVVMNLPSWALNGKEVFFKRRWNLVKKEMLQEAVAMFKCNGGL